MSQIAKFIAVGLVNTGVGLACMWGAMAVLGLGIVPANALGYAVGIGVSFLLNRAWTFAHQGPWLASFLRWLVIVAIAYSLNLLAVLTVNRQFRIDPYLSQLAGVVVYTAVSFLGARFFAFAARPGGSAGH